MTTEKIDILKDVTDKEIAVIAHLEFMEDCLWVEGLIINIGGTDVPMKGDSYGRSNEELKTIWKGCIHATQTEECWKDGAHAGDCTHVPMTCFRCLCEDRVEKARKYINWFNTEYNNW